MGQKTHPIAFRLGINQSHQSKWFLKPKIYSMFLLEDYFLRKSVLRLFRNINISKILIYRGLNNSIKLTLYLPKSNSTLTKNSKIFQNLRKNLENEIKIYRQQQRSLSLPKGIIMNSKDPTIILHALEFPSVDSVAFFTTDFLVEQLEKRISFRKAMKKALRRAQKTNKIKGIKICVSGRLNGAEIARSEWIRRGQVPLQTLRAEIAYCYRKAKTIYGILGVKIWILKK